MASKNKTEMLGLNLWDGTDRPQRGDFNSDNILIDEALGAHLADETLHLTATEKERVRRPVQSFSYVGNGSAEGSVTLPVTPSVVIVYCDGMPRNVYDSANACTRVYGGVAVYGAGASAGICLEGNVVKLMQSTSPANGVMNCLNENGRQYKVVMIR